MPDLEKASLVLTEPIVYRRRWYILTGTVVILNSDSQIDQILRHFTCVKGGKFVTYTLTPFLSQILHHSSLSCNSFYHI